MNQPKKVIKKFGTFLDPFLIVGIFILFLIPVITVINLTPGQKIPEKTESVLGAADPTLVNLLANTNTAEGITVTKVTQNSDHSYTLYIEKEAHQKGVYQNKLFTASNGTPDEKRIHVTSNFEGIAPGTKVSVVVDGVRFIVLNSDGTTYPPTIYLTPGSAVSADIEIDSPTDVNFVSGFSFVLTIE